MVVLKVGWKEPGRVDEKVSLLVLDLVALKVYVKAVERVVSLDI